MLSRIMKSPRLPLIPISYFPMNSNFRLTHCAIFLCFVMLSVGCGGGGGGGAATTQAVTPPPTPTPTPTCYGSAIGAQTTILSTPVVPQPVAASDIVGFIIQNTDSAASTQRYTSFGQVFVAGKVQTSDTLSTAIGGVATPVQMDALATWPDGSVKLASLTLQVPVLCASSQVSALLSKAAATSTTPVSLTSTKPALTVTLSFTSGSYSGSQTIDLGAALQTTLASAPDYWLRGPLATQARVDVPIANGVSDSSSTLHLTADVTLYADGSAMADVQFNNDLTTVIAAGGTVGPQAPLAALAYTATINFQSTSATRTVSQDQYADWNSIVWSSTTPQFNVQHDIAQLISAGATLPYDVSTGVTNSLPQNYDKNILQATDFGLPLARNGITRYMPNTGGRPDIGFTTQFNTVWLLTQDARAAKVAMAQGDTAGAVPWNYKLSNGRWLTPAEVSNVWVDNVLWRGGAPYKPYSGIANKANTDPDNLSSGLLWMPDGDHQPNLSYVPYLMSGARWNLDRLSAQAAFSLVNISPDARCQQPTPQSTSTCDIVLNGSNQVRGQAWAFRELRQAAFIAHPGSHESAVFSQAVTNNWAYVKSQQPAWAAKQGQATGWVPGAYTTAGVTPEWQQDFLTGMAVMSARMGDADARAFVTWQQPWLSGRFIGSGMNPYDGCTYNLMVMDPSTSTYLNTWSAIEAATLAAKDATGASLSNGSTWANSNGYYCALARSSLIGALALTPSDTGLKQALTWLQGSGAPYIDQASFQGDPTFNLASPK